MANDAPRKDRSEIAIGLGLAMLAAAMTLCNMGVGRFSYYFAIASEKQTEAFSWYQSKSIKQSLMEGERDMLKSLVKADAIKPQAAKGIDEYVTELDQDAGRYKKEKEEILNGSATVGKDNWAQVIDGELGKVRGANEWKAEADRLGNAAGLFESGTLYLQLSLVFGSIALLLGAPVTRWLFFTIMMSMGVVGSVYTYLGFAAL